MKNIKFLFVLIMAVVNFMIFIACSKPTQTQNNTVKPESQPSYISITISPSDEPTSIKEDIETVTGETRQSFATVVVEDGQLYLKNDIANIYLPINPEKCKIYFRKIHFISDISFTYTDEETTIDKLYGGMQTESIFKVVVTMSGNRIEKIDYIEVLEIYISIYEEINN